MRQAVYVETSIISYLAARPSRDLVVAARQQITQTWWADHRRRYRIFVSPVVVEEIGDGDASQARTRLQFISGIPSLEVTPRADDIAVALIAKGPLPRKAARDALHLAVAAEQKMDFLLTWNCRHLANASILVRAYDLLAGMGLRPPLVCTPDELTEEVEDG